MLANVGDCQAVYHGRVKSAPGAAVTAQTVRILLEFLLGLGRWTDKCRHPKWAIRPLLLSHR